MAAPAVGSNHVFCILYKKAASRGLAVDFRCHVTVESPNGCAATLVPCSEESWKIYLKAVIVKQGFLVLDF